MTRVEKSDARESVLVVAEELFGEHGYRCVTMGDEAEVLGMLKASLYYHFPGGKEELYVEVMYKMLERYRSEMEDAIEKASPGIRDQLRAAVE
nr:TetR/AcrR family transcriptional regulator [Actinomycetota bacterium]